LQTRRVPRDEQTRLVRADEASAVDQGQRALRADVEEVDIVLACTERLLVAGVGRAEAERRDFVNRVRQVRLPAGVDVGARNGLRRQQTVELAC
jgi:D-arabinose 5-phosphate isomerase GutQ